MVSCSASSTLSTYAVLSVTSMAYSSSHSCVGAWRRRAGRARGTPGTRRGPCWLRGWGGGATGRWTGVSRAPSRGVRAAGGHFAGRGGRGPRGHLLQAPVLAWLGTYAVPCPPCVGPPALAGCRCPGPWGHPGRAGVLLCGAVGVLCWCSGYVWRPVRGRKPVPGEARGLAWLWRASARWWLSRPAVSPLGAVWVVAGGGRSAGVWCAGFPGVVPVGGRGAEPAWRGVVPVLVGCGVSCPRVGLGDAVWHGGAGLRGGLPGGGGGGTVSRSGGVGGPWWLVLGRCRAAPCGLLVVPLVCFRRWAVRGRCGVGPGVPWGGLCGISSVATRGVWSRGAFGCGPNGEWAQWCRERCVWATRGLPRLWGPLVGGLWHPGRVVAPVRRPWVMGGMYCLHGRGGAMGSCVGWVRGGLPAGSGCWARTVGGCSAVSPRCVSWWPLVGWLGGVFGVYRIHGGTIVCWRAAAGCGSGACVGVVRLVGGGVSCVVLGGSSWWSVVAVRGGCSWAWRFLGGCGTCGVGMVGGWARVCVGSCVRPLLPLRFLPLPFPCLSLCACSFFFSGGVSVVGRFRCLAWVWVRAGAGVGVGVGVVGDGRLLRSGFPVCVSALRHLVAFGFWGAGPGGAGSGWLAAVVAWCLRGRSRLLGSALVAWLDAGVRVGVFMA